MLAFLVVTGIASLVAQTAPQVGTWQLNIAKSTFDPGPPPKSQTRVYEIAGDMLTATQVNVQGNGIESGSSYSARFDGKDYPATGSPVYDSIALTRIDARTFQATLKKAGKIVQTATNVVSKDGNMMSVAVSGADASTGRKFTTILVFDRR